MLQLEQSLKSLQTERATYLQNNVQADATLTSLYSSLAEQENALSNWTRNIVKSAGNGVVSFYFDGYERVLNASQIDTINAALINSVVRGGNTASSLSTNTSETPLYRLVAEHTLVYRVCNARRRADAHDGGGNSITSYLTIIPR